MKETNIPVCNFSSKIYFTKRSYNVSWQFKSILSVKNILDWIMPLIYLELEKKSGPTLVVPILYNEPGLKMAKGSNRLLNLATS